MSKCFISYRHVKPDKELVQYLEKFLQEHNHHVFVDKHMVVFCLASARGKGIILQESKT